MIGPADLIDFHSGLKASDLKNWKHVPASAVVQLTAEMKADLEARAAMVRQLQDESDAQRAANAALYGSTAESNQMIRTNVAALDAAGVQIEMSIVTKIIQSIASDNPFRSTAADITAAGLSYGFLITVSHRHDGTPLKADRCRWLPSAALIARATAA